MTSYNENRFKIVWEGSQLVNHSLAHVNREICSELIRSGKTELSLIPFEPDDPEFAKSSPRFKNIPDLCFRELSGNAEFHIRHHWPPKFNRPKEGILILMQPWEFGHLPASWINPIISLVDEVWVYSGAVKQCYIDSGINPHKVYIIPLGINPHIFNIEISALPLETDKKFKFLFVGGTIWRKGIDLLLDVYTSAFSKSDDVCLVIKDMGGSTFYKGMNAAERISEIVKSPSAPEILYLSESMPEKAIAGLYKSCDCLVHPYRGEGFGLPAAEAMAAGLPVILTSGGSTDDFCPPGMVNKIPSEKILVNIEIPLIKQGWALQPDANVLRNLMLEAVKNPESLREKASKACKHIHENFTWKQTSNVILNRLAILREQKKTPESVLNVINRISEVTSTAKRK